MLLEDLGDVVGLLLFLLNVVLSQRRPVCSSAANLPGQRIGRRRPLHSSFAIGCPAAKCPGGGTGLTGGLGATVRTQLVQSVWLGKVHVIQAVASRQPVPSLQSGEEITRARRVGLWGPLQKENIEMKTKLTVKLDISNRL